MKRGRLPKLSVDALREARMTIVMERSIEREIIDCGSQATCAVVTRADTWRPNIVRSGIVENVLDRSRQFRKRADDPIRP